MNRTKTYISPLVKVYRDFITKFPEDKYVEIIGRYINDCNIWNKYKFDSHIFLHLLVNNYTAYNEFIEWLREQYYYQHDYVLSENNHVIVIKVDTNAVNMFVRSKYSKMITNEELYKLYPYNTVQIMKKDEKKILELEEYYNVNREHISELDSKINIRVELLNDNIIKDNEELQNKFNQFYSI